MSARNLIHSINTSLDEVIAKMNASTSEQRAFDLVVDESELTKIDEQVAALCDHIDNVLNLIEEEVK